MTKVVPNVRGRRGSQSERRWKEEWDSYAGFVDRGGGHKPRSAGVSLEAGKDHEVDSPLEPPEGAQPC